MSANQKALNFIKRQITPVIDEVPKHPKKQTNIFEWINEAEENKN